ncbi:hypothetical protein GQ44DRAFT_773885 [Phaeosphaeriaceae sp. PMI808]|nr:hypothetical protein GQ44DRAFT_773885 [Phaeosphaeriaceae sp. PMI808]
MLIKDNFASSAFLRCLDIHPVAQHFDLNTPTGTTYKKEWCECRWATTWELATRLSDVAGTMMILSHAIRYTNGRTQKPMHGSSRYNSIPLLVSKILDTCQPVRFHSARPPKPFDVVEVTAFDFMPPHALPSLHISATLSEPNINEYRARMSTVDLHVSSMFSVPFTPSTDHAFANTITILSWFSGTRDANLNDRSGASWGRYTINERTFSHKADDMHRKYTVWVIDVEFGIMRGACPTPYILTIRDAKTEDIIISTTVDYEGRTLQSIEDELEQHQSQFGVHAHKIFGKANYFSNFYQARTTSGMSLAAIDDFIRAAGFSLETHRVLGWFKVFDACVFGRALLGLFRPVCSTTKKRLAASTMADKYQQINAFRQAHVAPNVNLQTHYDSLTEVRKDMIRQLDILRNRRGHPFRLLRVRDMGLSTIKQQLVHVLALQIRADGNGVSTLTKPSQHKPGGGTASSNITTTQAQIAASLLTIPAPTSTSRLPCYYGNVQ